MFDCKNGWKNISKIDCHAHVVLRKMLWTDIHKNTPENYLEVMKFAKRNDLPVIHPF